MPTVPGVSLRDINNNLVVANAQTAPVPLDGMWHVINTD